MKRSWIKRGKPLKRVGPVTKKWLSTRQLWIKNNPEPYSCHYCGVLLDKSTLTLDHVKSRSRRPDLRYDQNNLVPSCWECNTKKGSKDHV